MALHTRGDGDWLLELNEGPQSLERADLAIRGSNCDVDERTSGERIDRRRSIESAETAFASLAARLEP